MGEICNLKYTQLMFNHLAVITEMGDAIYRQYEVVDPILLCSLGCEWYSIGDGVCNPQADLDNERRP